MQYTGKGPTEGVVVGGVHLEDEEADPLADLGFGFEAYFKMLNVMTIVFLVLTALFIPEMVMYKNGGAISSGDFGTSVMLGNLGFAGAVCISDYATLQDQRTIGCGTGGLAALYSYGIIPTNATETGWQDDNYFSQCMSQDDVSADVAGCTSYLDTATLVTYFNDNCQGKLSCDITLADYILAGTGVDYDSCTTENARVYLQYFCAESNDFLVHKRQVGLGIVCLGVFATSIYMLTVFYLNRTAELDYKLWDLQTLTAADFTAEMTITDDMYNELFLKMSQVQEPMPTKAVPAMSEMRRPVIALAQHIENEVTRRLNPLPRVIEDSTDIRIAHISFAFDNKELLQALIARGSLITAGKFDKLRECNQKIDKMVTEDADKLQRPVAAFITFERQEGFERAMMYFPQKPGDREVNEDFVDPVPPGDK